MKRMLVSDYDNTFYINELDIINNVEIIKKFRKNNLFTIATGRSFKDFNEKKDLYNIEYDYLIINHGATILDKSNKVLFNFSINNNIIKQLKQELEKEEIDSYFCCSLLDSRVDFNNLNLTKINIRYKDSKVIKNMQNNILNKFSNEINCYIINDYTIEIISSKIDKAKAINLISNNNIIYTIGDSYNDLTMIKKYNGSCMENSIKLLKENYKSYKSVSLLVKEIMKSKGENI